MGLFNKIFGRDDAPGVLAPPGSTPKHRTVARPVPPPAATPPSVGTVRLAGCGRVAVVGESHYQHALRTAAGGRSARGDLRNAIAVPAVLVPEPSNSYDRNAVRVDVYGRTVGYLAREDAPGYQAVLLPLMGSGKVGWCPARIMGGGDRYYGIHLHLSEPETLICANDPGVLEILDTDRSVIVTGKGKHQDVLAEAAASRDVAPVFAALGVCTVAKGKYAGMPTIEVRINGHRVGELTKTMGDRYLPFVRAAQARGTSPGAEAVIKLNEKGYQVHVHLPQA